MYKFFINIFLIVCCCLNAYEVHEPDGTITIMGDDSDYEFDKLVERLKARGYVDDNGNLEIPDINGILSHENPLYELVDVFGGIAGAPIKLRDELTEVAEYIFPESWIDMEDYDSFVKSEDFDEMIDGIHESVSEFTGDGLTKERREQLNRQRAKYIIKNEIPFGYKTPRYGKLPATRASNTCGWKRGDPINNLTNSGKVPKWDAVRKRHWKNRGEAERFNYNSKFTEKQIKKMMKGKAPTRNRPNGVKETMELHHDPPQRDGGLFEFKAVWPDEHADIDPHRHLKK